MGSTTPNGRAYYDARRQEQTDARTKKQAWRDYKQELANVSAELTGVTARLKRSPDNPKLIAHRDAVLEDYTRLMRPLQRRVGEVHTVAGRRYIVTQSGAWRRLAT